jgi:hypothetical protein
MGQRRVGAVSRDRDMAPRSASFRQGREHVRGKNCRWRDVRGDQGMQRAADGTSRARKRKKKRKLSDLPPLNPKELAAACLTDARSYLKAARVLNQAGDMAGLFPSYFVLCHLLELILKAYLAAHGADEPDLRYIGHDLLLAYACARRKGLKPLDERTAEVIRWLSPFREDMLFRYRQHLGSVSLPDSKEVADVASTLVEQIDPIVRSRFMSG